MKLRVLISLLFITATTFASIHEVEHIHGEHDSASCQVCIVDDNSNFFDIVDNSAKINLFSSESITSKNAYFCIHTKKTTNHSNAPPKLS